MPGNALRQFLNSIDLRVIKNIEDDTANIECLEIDNDKKFYEGKAIIENGL